MADGNDRRYPNSLQGLLKFCTEYTKSEDVQGSSNIEMTDERKQWLKEAMDSLGANDPVKIMLGKIQILLNVEESVERQEEALEEVKEYCEDLDLANDFYKIGGCHLLSKLLASDKEGLRWRAADLIAVLTQNNPTSQQAILQLGLLPILLEKVESGEESVQVRIKSLYAISCLIRGNDEVIEEFTRLDGLSILLRSLQSNVEKLCSKSAFIISSLCTEKPQIRDMLCDMGMVEQIVALLHRDHSSFDEFLLQALVCLVENHERAREECQRPEFHLREVLERRKKYLQENQEEFREEIEFVNRLQQTLQYLSSESQSSSMDR